MRQITQSRGSKSKGRAAGFTLVELLVVIVIISMLVGLLLPAVNSVRARARITQCSNNQHELSVAIHGYESAKQHLPGYINRVLVNGTPDTYVAVSWVPVLFQYLGRGDLWEGPSRTDGWRGGSPISEVREVTVGQLACPEITDSTVARPLSYVVNTGDAYLPSDDDGNEFFAPKYDNGLFTNLVPVLWSASATIPQTVSLSSVRSPGQRPLLSERRFPIRAKERMKDVVTVLPDSTTADRAWNSICKSRKSITGSGLGSEFMTTSLLEAKLTPRQLGFPWQSRTRHNTNALTLAEILPPVHPGIVIITFCDGRTESLSEDTDISTFDYP